MENVHANEVEILSLNEKELEALSGKMLLSFSVEEFREIQAHYKKKKRNPTDIELETLAQTWSEHCKHKTFNSGVEFTKNGKKTVFSNLIKETIFSATREIAKKKKGFLVSVFKDNAGIISFNKKFDLAFKAETHNHPSALEPYGGASTGIGGVIRDVLGAGLGAKPIANTDTFCFGYWNLPHEKLPKGILHPKRIFKGVRAGVRDYGNRMGIPTVNGAIYFDERFTGNPLVYCGTLGIMPKRMHKKGARKGDLAVVMGDKTGRDGIHGVTFASVELEEESPPSAVQIGNPIEEKKFMDVLLKARDQKLYTAITDCGGGGFSSAIGEMGEELGVRVELDKAPLKYRGLKPWEIWVSESQERMVLAVPKEKFKKLSELCGKEDVSVTAIGEFTGKKKLELYFKGSLVGEMEMAFLHKGLPKCRLKAEWKDKKVSEKLPEPKDSGEELLKLLSHPNISSKETTIRQYDHEVQGTSVLKPLVGEQNDSPGDAAIIKPLFGFPEGAVLANGINPRFGELSPYWMAASAIDEAIRNIVAVGGDTEKIALLDNFCWGNPRKPELLGGIVEATLACRDYSIAFNSPFISGKDSLYNEFSSGGKTVSIPGTLLVSAVGVMDDARKRISMDLKEEGSLLYIVGETFDELGGSHYCWNHGKLGEKIPKVDAKKALNAYRALSKASSTGLKNNERVIRSMHDCSQGGLGVSAAEMAFAGMKGLEIDLSKVPYSGEKRNDFILFSESNSRMLIEVPEKFREKFEKLMKGSTFALIGKVTQGKELVVKGLNGSEIIRKDLSELKNAWKETLNW